MRASSLAELYAEAARGLFSLIVPDLNSIQRTETVSFEIEGNDRDYLLFDWLNELLYRYETEHLLLADFEVDIDNQGLRARAFGERADSDRHELDHEVKAITYHGLVVSETDDGWFAECIVDI